MSSSSSFAGSLWSALTPPRPALEAAQDGAADTVVIGGGFLGLSIALALASGGADVVVLEADEVGFGASGRNTGFVVPALKGTVGLGDAVRLVGRDKAETLMRAVGSSGTALFELVRRLGIACDAEPTGVLQPAPNAGAMRGVDRYVAEMARLGLPVDALDGPALFRATGVPGYLGAIRLGTGGQLNPLAYAAGLSSAATDAGARIRYGRAVSIEPAGAGWRVGCADGAALRATVVVVATNALVGALVPAVRRSLLPVRVYQVATQVMGSDLRAALLPERQPLVDLRNNPFALRWSPDNRLITGGGGIIDGGDATGRMSRYLLRRLATLVPGLPPLRAEHAWSGTIAATGDFMPRLWTLGPGLFAPIGCNGRGVALTTALGRATARYLLGGAAADLPLPITSPRPWRLHGAMRMAPGVWLAQARLRDWRAGRGMH